MTFLQLIASFGNDGVPANNPGDLDSGGPLSPMMLNPTLVLQATEAARRSPSETRKSVLVTEGGERRKPLTFVSFERFHAEICGDGRAANDDSPEGHDTAMA